MKIRINCAAKGRSPLLAARAAQSVIDSDKPVGSATYIEYENGACFEVIRTKTGVTVWSTSVIQ